VFAFIVTNDGWIRFRNSTSKSQPSNAAKPMENVRMVKTVHRILDSASCRCGYGERESDVVELNFYFRGDMEKSILAHRHGTSSCVSLSTQMTQIYCSRWYGTLVTITPFLNSNAPFNKSELWLWRKCCHHFAGMNSGTTTVIMLS